MKKDRKTKGKGWLYMGDIETNTGKKKDRKMKYR